MRSQRAQGGRILDRGPQLREKRSTPRNHARKDKFHRPLFTFTRQRRPPSIGADRKVRASDDAPCKNFVDPARRSPCRCSFILNTWLTVKLLATRIGCWNRNVAEEKRLPIGDPCPIFHATRDNKGKLYLFLSIHSFHFRGSFRLFLSRRYDRVAFRDERSLKSTILADPRGVKTSRGRDRVYKNRRKSVLFLPYVQRSAWKARLHEKIPVNVTISIIPTST